MELNTALWRTSEAAKRPASLAVRERLSLRASILEIIDRRREEAGDPCIGLNIEERILDRELRDLELATLADEQRGTLTRSGRAGAFGRTVFIAVEEWLRRL